MKGEKYVVVVGNTVPVGTLSRHELLQIFTGTSNVWYNGMPMHVTILVRQHPASTFFVHDYLELSLNDYFDRVEAHNNSGKSNRINIVPLETLVRLSVVQHIGSIGYTGVDTVSDNFNLQVIPLQ